MYLTGRITFLSLKDKIIFLCEISTSAPKLRSRLIITRTPMEVDTPMNQAESASWIQTMSAQLLSQGAEAVRPVHFISPCSNSL